MRRKGTLVLLAFLVVASFPGRAAAEDRAQAEVLFERGKKLVEQRDYAAGCRALEQSVDLYRGLATLLWLGDCLEKVGRLASAQRAFEEAATIAAEKKDAREAVARKRASTLDERVARLVVHVTEPASDLTVTRNGRPFERADWERPLAVDPGLVVVTASRPGRITFEQQVTIPSAPGTVRIEVPSLALATAVAVGKDIGREKGAPKPGIAVDAGPADAGSGRTRRIVGFGAMGIGAVGLGLGTFFGLRAMGLQDDSNQPGRCGANDVCSSEGLSLRSDANGAALASTIAFAAGAVFVAGGLVLLLTSPKSTSVSLVERSLLSGTF